MKQNVAVQPQAKQLADFPDYVQAVAKLEDLQNQQRNVRNEISSIGQRLAREPLGLDGAAEQLLRGELETESGWLATRDALNTQLREKERRLQILDIACVKQECAVRDVRGNASREICASVKAVHDAANRRAFVGLIELLRGHIEALEVRETLGAQGISVNQALLPPIDFFGQLAASSDPRDRNSGVAYLLREAISKHVIRVDEVPERWRIAWSR